MFASLIFMEAGPSFSHLNHLSSLQLLDVTELAGVADHFATLHIDNALRMRGLKKKKKSIMRQEIIVATPHSDNCIVT